MTTTDNKNKYASISGALFNDNVEMKYVGEKSVARFSLINDFQQVVSGGGQPSKFITVDVWEPDEKLINALTKGKIVYLNGTINEFTKKNGEVGVSIKANPQNITVYEIKKGFIYPSAPSSDF